MTQPTQPRTGVLQNLPQRNVTFSDYSPHSVEEMSICRSVVWRKRQREWTDAGCLLWPTNTCGTTQAGLHHQAVKGRNGKYVGAPQSVVAMNYR
jgi:hypothetical protein